MANICKHLFLGSYKVAGDDAQLTNMNIGCIVNVAKGCQNLFPQKYDYINVPFDDDSYIPKNIMDALIEIVREYIVKKINVLIHCKRGKIGRAHV